MTKYTAVKSREYEEHLYGGEKTIILNPEDYLFDVSNVLGEFDTLEEAIEEANAYGPSRISAAPFGFYVEVFFVRKDEYDADGEYEQGDVQWISPLPAQFTAKNGLTFNRSAWNENHYGLEEGET